MKNGENTLQSHFAVMKNGKCAVKSILQRREMGETPYETISQPGKMKKTPAKPFRNFGKWSCRCFYDLVIAGDGGYLLEEAFQDLLSDLAGSGSGCGRCSLANDGLASRFRRRLR